MTQIDYWLMAFFPLGWLVYRAWKYFNNRAIIQRRYRSVMAGR